MSSTRYSIFPRERRYVKGYGFLSFARSFGKKAASKIGDAAVKHGKEAAAKAGKRALTKAAEATGDVVGQKIADKISKAAQPKAPRAPPTTQVPTQSQSQATESTPPTRSQRNFTPEEREKILRELRLAASV